MPTYPSLFTNVDKHRYPDRRNDGPGGILT